MQLLQVPTTKSSTSKPKQSDKYLRVVDLTVDRPHDGNYKMFKFKNTYTQDNRHLFQLIGQIHGKMLLNIDLLPCRVVSRL